jgi:hypothetical protein
MTPAALPRADAERVVARGGACRAFRWCALGAPNSGSRSLYHRLITFCEYHPVGPVQPWPGVLPPEHGGRLVRCCHLMAAATGKTSRSASCVPFWTDDSLNPRTLQGAIAWSCPAGSPGTANGKPRPISGQAGGGPAARTALQYQMRESASICERCTLLASIAFPSDQPSAARLRSWPE